MTIVPAGFQAPATFATAKFRLRRHSANDVVEDFDAVIRSTAHAEAVCPDGTRPDGRRLEQHLAGRGRQQQELQMHRSFACAVVDRAETQEQGRVRIDPSGRRGHDAEFVPWARQGELVGGLKSRLQQAAGQWIARDWPFAAAAFPGRDIGRKQRQVLPRPLPATGARARPSRTAP